VVINDTSVVIAVVVGAVVFFRDVAVVVVVVAVIRCLSHDTRTQRSVSASPKNKGENLHFHWRVNYGPVPTHSTVSVNFAFAALRAGPIRRNDGIFYNSQRQSLFKK